jgi:hypothetical protein
MSARGPHADPIAEYVDGLAATLRGPARVKARMVGEMRDGLVDAAAARTAEGMPDLYAAEQAVRDFGPLEELAPACQRELTIAQMRHTARTVAFAVPILLVCWFVIWSGGHGWPLRLLAAQLVVVAVGAALLATGALMTTGGLARRLPAPDSLPLAVAWTGTATSVAIAIATLAIITVSVLTGNWPLTALAGALAVAAHGMVAASSRACRECARTS